MAAAGVASLVPRSIRGVVQSLFLDPAHQQDGIEALPHHNIRTKACEFAAVGLPSDLPGNSGSVVTVTFGWTDYARALAA